MRPPLNHMRIRENSSHNLYDHVRDRGSTFHAGWDLAAPSMTPAYAVADGTVLWVQFFTQPHLKNKVKGNVWQSVLIKLNGKKHPGQQLFAFYAYLSHENVGENDHVVVGQQIGLTGITGYPFKSHVPVVPDAQAYPLGEAASKTSPVSASGREPAQLHTARPSRVIPLL